MEFSSISNANGTLDRSIMDCADSTDACCPRSKWKRRLDDVRNYLAILRSNLNPRTGRPNGMVFVASPSMTKKISGQCRRRDPTTPMRSFAFAFMADTIITVVRRLRVIYCLSWVLSRLTRLPRSSSNDRYGNTFRYRANSTAQIIKSRSLGI